MSATTKTFSLEPIFANHRVSGAMLADPLGKALGLERLERMYEEITAVHPGGREFIEAALLRLGVRVRCTEEDMALIPKDGPTIVVANHPMGSTEGLILAHLLTQVRDDVRILATGLAARIPAMQEYIIAVDSFGDSGAEKRNAKGLLKAMHWVRRGGLLVVFPAGAVARFNWHRRRVTDLEWQPGVAHMVRRTGAKVLPVYIDGHTGPLFPIVGGIGSRVRAMMIARLTLGQRGHKIPVRIGHAFANSRLQDFPDDQSMTDYLRLRCFLLGRATKTRTHAERAHDRRLVPIVDPVPQERIVAEVTQLPAEQKLVSSGACDVYYAHAEQIPATLFEIGRLREITFRGVGEGTGQAIDLTPHDEYYTHLFVWNRDNQEIVGAYRIGQLDHVIEAYGIRGIYTHEFFHLSRRLFKRLGPGCLELGRSFVQEKYQRAPTSLLLLWKGISHYVAKHPQYRYLIGPVSISADYAMVSRQLLCRSLRHEVMDRDLAHLVRPRHPFHLRNRHRLCPDADLKTDLDLKEVNELISDLEIDHKGMPILVKQYLKLGGKILAFNVDPDFGNVIDALLLVDLAKTDPKRLGKYMGKENVAAYQAKHV